MNWEKRVAAVSMLLSGVIIFYWIYGAIVRNKDPIVGVALVVFFISLGTYLKSDNEDSH